MESSRTEHKVSVAEEDLPACMGAADGGPFTEEGEKLPEFQETHSLKPSPLARKLPPRELARDGGHFLSFYFLKLIFIGVQLYFSIASVSAVQ